MSIPTVVRSFSNDLCMDSLPTEEDFQSFERLAARFHLFEIEKWMQIMREEKKSVTLGSVKRLSLYDIDFDNCKIDLGHLGDFLGMMPCLERLDVNFCGGATHPEANRNINDSADEDAGEFLWEEVQEMLAQRKSTLKHVNMEFHNYFPLFEGSLELWKGHLGSFIEFHALEKLLVRVSSFDKPLVAKFVDLLPESLTLLGLRDIPQNWDGVEKLAYAVRNGRLPRLKKAVLDLGQDEFEVARAQLDLADVTCVRYDYDYHPFGRHFPFFIYRFFNRTLAHLTTDSPPTPLEG
ncbi:hypothetical protein GGI43DRAFT_421937 [Trichoderma evansii]